GRPPAHGGAARPAGALLSGVGGGAGGGRADAHAGPGARLLCPLRRPDLAGQRLLRRRPAPRPRDGPPAAPAPERAARPAPCARRAARGICREARPAGPPALVAPGVPAGLVISHGPCSAPTPRPRLRAGETWRARACPCARGSWSRARRRDRDSPAGT